MLVCVKGQTMDWIIYPEISGVISRPGAIIESLLCIKPLELYHCLPLSHLQKPLYGEKSTHTHANPIKE